MKLTENENQARKELSYEWVARYMDGTSLYQYDDKNQLEHHFGHIDQDKVYEFEILPTRLGLFPIRVNLKTGLFYFNNEPLLSIHQEDTYINIGISLYNKSVTSTWGNKAKLIYVRHVIRNFTPGDNGFAMDVHIDHEIGWEATVDGEHRKYSIIINELGAISLPKSFEQGGFLPI